MSETGETQRQFAQRVGLSQGRIAQLVKDGLPLLPSGRIDVSAALRWLEQNLDQARSARAKGITVASTSEPAVKAKPVATARSRTAAPPPVSASVVPPMVSTTPTAPVAPAAGGVTLAEARRQFEIVRVANARLRFDKERGKLISRDDVKVFIFSRARKERNAMLGFALRVSPLMAADLQVDPALMFSVLDRYIREQLTELSKTPLADFPE